MDFKMRIEVAKVNHRKAEQAKIETETNLKNAIKQKDEVIEKMKAAGVTPETIVTEKERLEAKIEADLKSVESLLPTL